MSNCASLLKLPYAGVNAPPALDISGLPVFTLTRTEPGPLMGKVYKVTDPDRALISGQLQRHRQAKGAHTAWAGVACAIFPHNGSAATLLDVVNFYDQRFSIGFTDQQKTDLVNFLNAL